ncbi:arabinofuranosyltransferase [Saccharomonospora iraqiensis]|uniref:arabinofuranosyltransferase n=1 Tax=Saccharomonospora iraqiensis TaxID=52698 RepID=UPI00022DF13E|nr:arabinofuranosyltransferase [Saccharomonospora iraqiensis]
MVTTHDAADTSGAHPDDEDPGRPGTVPGRPPFGTPGGTVAALLLGGGYAVLLSAAWQAVVARLPVSGTETYVPEALLVAAVTVLFAVVYPALGSARVRRWPTWLKHLGVWTTLSTLATLVLALPLHATRFFLGGASVDNTFRLQYLERASSSAALQDMNYVDLPPYYPAGWFWLGGRVAEVAGMSGWEAYKPYAIAWCALTAVVAYVLYTLVLRRRTAFLAALVTTVAGFVTVGVEEPYAWPTTAWLPPVALLAWAALRRRDRAPWWVLGVVGVYLGVCGLTYTLHLGFGALLVVLLAVLAVVAAVREGERFGPALRRSVGRTAVVAVVSAVLAALVWAPFVAAGGLAEPSLAPNFLPQSGAYLPTPFTVPSVFGLLCLVGLVWAVAAAFTDTTAFVLAVLAAAVYAWFGLSTLALLGETTLLSFRFVPTVGLTLAVAGVLGVLAGARWLRGWLATRPGTGWSGPRVRVLVTVLAVAGSVVMVQDAVRADLSGVIDDAESDYYPTGRTPDGQRDPSDPAAWTPQLTDAIDRMTAGGPTGQVLLTEQHHLLMFSPYWNFQQLTPHYANPLARYDERAAEIRSWADADDAATLRARLADGPFPPPTVFVLDRRDDGTLRYTLTSSVFPRSDPVAGNPVSFDPEVFDAPGFERRDVGPFTVVAVRS